MRRSRGGAAFYVETLLLVLFLLASLTVLVQILGAAKRTSREARELSIPYVELTAEQIQMLQTPG